MQALEDCGIILLVEGSLYRPLGRIDFMEPSLLVAGAVFVFRHMAVLIYVFVIIYFYQ